MPRDSILCCADDDNPYNNIVKENEDYVIISKEQWALLEENYVIADKVQVYPIKRYFEKLGMGIRTFLDLQYTKVRISENNLTNSLMQ